MSLLHYNILLTLAIGLDNNSFSEYSQISLKYFYIVIANITSQHLHYCE